MFLSIGKGSLNYHLHDEGPARAHLHVPHIEPELQMRTDCCSRAVGPFAFALRIAGSGGGRVWHVTHAHPKERFQERRFAVALHWQRDVICRKNRSACS